MKKPGKGLHPEVAKERRRKVSLKNRGNIILNYFLVAIS